MLLVGFGLSQLSRTTYVASLIFIPLIWLPGVRNVFAEPSRSWEPYPEVGLHLDASRESNDLIIVHSIPSGVLGVARYVESETPIASWVVRLKMRTVPDDIQRFSSSYRRAVLVKIHDLNEPSPAEAWLLQNETLQRRERLSSQSEVLYFSSGGDKNVARP